MYLKGEGKRQELGYEQIWNAVFVDHVYWIAAIYDQPCIPYSTFCECGETVQPMKVGVTAVLVNLVFNYLLFMVIGFQSWSAGAV